MNTYTFFRVTKNVYLDDNGHLTLTPPSDPRSLFFDPKDKFMYLPSQYHHTAYDFLAKLIELDAIRVFFRLPCRLVEPVLVVQDIWKEWFYSAKPSRTHMALLIAAAVITLCIMLTGIIAPIVYFCR